MRGRLLNTYSKNDATISYSYDTSGVRTQKVESSITHKYVVLKNNILREDRVSASGTDSLVFYYGMNGIAGFGLKRAGESAYTRYYYAKNVQGDIESIYDVQGNKIAEYAYDAWGQHIVKASVNGIAELNPYRYRGYYYDTETGLYYLQTRYYDPVVCRFISADNAVNVE